MNWIDWIGYMGAALVVASFLVPKNIRLLRSINLSGALFFITYGILLDVNLPVIIPNVFIVGIQSYFLITQKDRK